MSNELFKDLLDLQGESAKDALYPDDIDVPFDLEPLETGLGFLPQELPADIELQPFPTPACEQPLEEEYSEDFFGDESDCLSKRTDLNGKKKRLKGEDLISSLRRNPMFRDHEELFQQNLDDLSRKKLMQKIRNRVSAQESRDRKKAQFGELHEKNFLLEKEKLGLRQENEQLRQENKQLRHENLRLVREIEELKEKLSRGESDSTNLESNGFASDDEPERPGHLFRVNGAPGSPLSWRPYLALVLVVATLCVLAPVAPGDSDGIKSSAIVPLVRSLPSAPSGKALVRLENVCDRFCKEKFAAVREAELRQKAIGSRLLSLTSDAVLQANETTLEVSLGQDFETGVALQAAAEYAPRPYSTLVCSAVLEREAEPQLQGSDEWIHLVYPKPQSAELLAEPGPVSEYEGVLAKVISRKAIRVVDSQLAGAASA